MSLQVWLPLNKNVIENKGLSDVVFTNTTGSFVDSGIESCYRFSGYSEYGIYFGRGTGGPTLCREFLNKYIDNHSFSLAGWFKTSSTYGNGTPLLYLGYGVSLKVGANTYFGLWCLDENSQSIGNTCSANATTNDNKWHHITGTYDISDNKMRIYIDGQLKNTVSFPTGKTYTTPSGWERGIMAGRNPNDSQQNDNYFYQGSLSDVRIYDHALSDKEVYELAKGLMFHLKLDNTDLYDCSGYGWDVSKYSGGTLTENSDTARYGKSLKFDNTYLQIPYLIKYDLQEFTISYWIKYNTLSGSSIFGARGSLYTGCYTALGGNGSTIWIVRFDTKQQNYSPGTYSIEANRWYHVTCVYKAGQFVKVYADDKYNTYTGTDAVSMSDANKNYNQIASSNFDGSISDFRIYRKALTDEQVAELYKVSGSIDNHGNGHCYELNEMKHGNIILDIPLKYEGDTKDLISGNDVNIGTGTMIWDSNKSMYKFAISGGVNYTYASKWNISEKYQIPLAYSGGYTVSIDVEQETENTNSFQAWCAVPSLEKNLTYTSGYRPNIYISPVRFVARYTKYIPLHRYTAVLDRCNQTISWYWDGEFKSSQAWGTAGDNVDKVDVITICQLYTNSTSFSMWAKNLKIYDIPMSAEEVREEYQKNKPN